MIFDEHSQTNLNNGINFAQFRQRPDIDLVLLPKIYVKSNINRIKIIVNYVIDLLIVKLYLKSQTTIKSLE